MAPFVTQNVVLFNAQLEAHKASHADRRTGFLAGSLEHVAHRHLVVADIRLFEQAHFLEELLHSTFSNLFNDGFGLAFFTGLLAIDFAFVFPSFGVQA